QPAAPALAGVHDALVDEGRRDGVAHPVDGQKEERQQDLLPQLRDDEDGLELAHGPTPSAPLAAKRATPPGLAPLAASGAAPCHAWARGFRGRILFRTGFLGGWITSAVPPLAVIFSAAGLLKWCALTTSLRVSSPSPRMRTPSAGPLARPTAFSAAW